MKEAFVAAFIFALPLLLLFYRNFLPGYVSFSNDGPLGACVAQQNSLPETLTGLWADLNWIGYELPAPSPTISTLARWILGPYGYSKLFYPMALFLLGMSAWFCFRQWKLSSLAALLGGLAAELSSHFLSTACWGVVAQIVAVSMAFLAIGILTDNGRKYSWVRVALGGMCVGMCVMEGYDIGAIFSVFIAAYVLYQAWVREGTAARRLLRGALRVAVVAVFAAFMATHALSLLIRTQIQGVAGTEQTAEAKEKRWDFATQWSYPPGELPRVFISGLFGYRMDTPRNMAQFGSWYEGGAYRGKVGRVPELDRAWDKYVAMGRVGEPPSAGPDAWRFSGGGEYAGLLVVLVGVWAFAQGVRRQDSVFSLSQRRLVWFWGAAAFASMLFAFGRFAPFYRILYQLPYFSTIRNPAKFMHTFDWALLVLFAYGIHGLSRRYLEPSNLPVLPLKKWWKNANPFEKNWVRVSIGLVAASLVGWLMFAASKASLEKDLQLTGIPDAATAAQVSTFSVMSVAWYIAFLVLIVTLLILILSGRFSGARARVGGLLLGALLVIDLMRADLPWVIRWDYPQKYLTNEVIDLFRKNPEQQRVTLFPLERIRLPASARPLLASFEKLYYLYHLEWKQQYFLYYNIHCLDLVQMPRVPEDLDAFERAVGPSLIRKWELTNTRYLLGPAAILDPILNQGLDPAQKRFRTVMRFDIVPKPGTSSSGDPALWAAQSNTNGEYAVFEFTGALPRVKLYDNWQTIADDTNTLQRLADVSSFDPSKTVLVAGQLSAAPATNASPNRATADIVSYAPKRVDIKCKTDAPSILLLNDKYDSNWKVSVDGKPATLLRCNYIMQGVQVPAGEHTVHFSFELSMRSMYVSVAAILLAVGMAGFLMVSSGTTQLAEGQPKTAARLEPAAKRA